MKKILIVAHDAGGAEILSSWVKTHPDVDYTFLLEGPAQKIFDRKLKNLSTIKRSVLDALNLYDMVLTGTGWGSDLERTAIQKSREQKIFVASYLDHWINYRQRFTCAEGSFFPNEIWVGDQRARELAQAAVPESTIMLHPNPYMEELVKSIQDCSTLSPKSGPTCILYVTEPTEAAARRTGNDRGYTEFEALNAYLSYLARAPHPNVVVRLRLHPSESINKYDAVLKPFRDRLAIDMSINRSLADDCGWAEDIVGCDSMVMALGVLSGKKVFCAIPPDGKPPALPFKEIVRLFPAQLKSGAA